MAASVFMSDTLDDISNKANCFNMQEEEEDSEEEEVDDNEESKKIVVISNFNGLKSYSTSTSFFTKDFLRNTVYLPGVPSPPPELS